MPKSQKRPRIPLNRLDQFYASQSSMGRVRDRRWLRMDELPFGKTLAFKLVKAGLLFSVLAAAPGSKRGVRLVEAESLDRYLRSLADPKEDQTAKGK
jgi:hypothetical protein